MAYRVVQVGTGGIGRIWCEAFLPAFVADGRIEVVAAVDVNPDALVNARKGLGLGADRCYTDLGRALAEHPADVCTIVVPPAFHEQVADAALDHGLHILSEKPIADTWPASVRIAQRVEKLGRKMSVGVGSLWLPGQSGGPLGTGSASTGGGGVAFGGLVVAGLLNLT